MAKKPFTFKKKKSSGNSEYHTVRGLVSYAKVYEPDDYRGQVKWKINLHPSDEEIKRIRSLGIQLKLHDPNEDKSGVPGKYFTFNRPAEKEFDGEVTYFPPPAIYDADGEPICVYEDDGDEIVMKGRKQIIGNGSEVELGVTVYQTKRFGKGCRLNWIKIIDLIEWVPEDKEEEEEDEIDSSEEEIEEALPKRKSKPAPEKKSSKDLPW